MKPVFSTTEMSEALLVQSALREADIEAVLENEGGALYAMGMPSPAVPYVISVPDQDEARGLEVVAETRQGRAADDPDDPKARSADREEEEAWLRRADRSKAFNRRVWAVVACLMFPPLIPYFVGKALSGEAGGLVALVATSLALLLGAWLVYQSQDDRWILLGILGALGLGFVPVMIAAARRS